VSVKHLLLSELRRRKVFKVGAAYLVVGWLLIQVASTVAPQLNLPGWVPRAITLVIAIGFPIALILSWIFDVGPGGIHREAVSAEAASSASADVVSTPASPAVSIGTAPEIPHKSIAVLPFADLSPTRDQEYFSDGMAEEILNALVKLKDLKVAGRTSSFSFKGKNEDLRGIGKTLSVAHVLEGSVRKHGDKVRITAQLIRTDNGYHLWSESYDGELSDVFELQERIARAIVRELDVILHGDQRQRLVPVATQNPEAYELYLQASAIFNRRDGTRLAQAIEMLHKSTSLDPHFARAYARLATIHALEPIYTPSLVDDAVEAVRRDAARAGEMDPSLGEPHSAIALVSLQEHRFVESRQAIDRALTLQPGDPTIGYWFGAISISTGYIAQGCSQLDRVLQADPLYPIALLWRGTQYVQTGDLDRGRTLLQKSVDTGLTHAWLGMHEITAASGRIEEATAQLARGLTVLGAGLPDGAPEILARAVYGDAAARAQGLALVDQFLASLPRVLPGALPYALLLMDDGPRALELCQRFRSTNNVMYLHRLWSPSLRALRGTPQFRTFTRSVGLTALWDHHGAPDGARRNASGEYVWE
jgi:TolB-like protein